MNGDGYADVIVGAFGYNSNTGRAYVYHGGPDGLSSSPVFTATGEATSNSFGWSVATAGDVNGDGYADVAVGAYSYNTNTGRAYVYQGGPDGLSSSPALTVTGESTGDEFGISVSTAGDVNGDGYADVVVGAYSYNGNTGRAYVYHGGAAGLSSSPALTITGESSSDLFGHAVAMAGDVNGDGYADVIVGASGTDSGTGQAYVYHGGAAGLSSSPALTITGESTSSYFGEAVATAGDVNGDGYADVIVGAGGDWTNTGWAYVYHGSAAGLTTSPAFTGTGEAIWDRFGSAVATAGDVNGDGYADVIVGAHGYNLDAGRVTVYQGNDGGGRLVLARQTRTDATPLQPWGLLDVQGDFRVQMTATDPLGRGRVKLQVQACPTGTPFGDGACLDHVSATWTDTTTATAGVTLTETITGLTPGTLYRWRARVLYDSPLMIQGPWRRFLGQSLEADLRTPNAPPVADAGLDQSASTLALVTLDGSGSSDPDGDLPLSYHWMQTGGPAVTLSDPAVVTPTFSAPSDPAVLTFTLAVTDSLGLPDPTPDEVVVTVERHRIYLPLVVRQASSGDKVIAPPSPVWSQRPSWRFRRALPAKVSVIQVGLVSSSGRARPLLSAIPLRAIHSVALRLPGHLARTGPRRGRLSWPSITTVQ